MFICELVQAQAIHQVTQGSCCACHSWQHVWCAHAGQQYTFTSDVTGSVRTAQAAYLWALAVCALVLLAISWPVTCELPSPEILCYRVPVSDRALCCGRVAHPAFGVRSLNGIATGLWFLEAVSNRLVNRPIGYYLPLAYVPCHIYIIVVTTLYLRSAQHVRVLRPAEKDCCLSCSATPVVAPRELTISDFGQLATAHIPQPLHTCITAVRYRCRRFA